MRARAIGSKGSAHLSSASRHEPRPRAAARPTSPSPRWRSRSSPAGASATSSRSRCGAARARRNGSSTRARRRRTGGPGSHHVLARVFKDVFPRYKTMTGHYVERKGGWDCHGLPVEIAVEQKLGFHSKDDIERYGIAEFNQQCRESVFEFLEDWTALTERIGYWVDLEHPYRTLDAVLRRVGLVGAQGDVGQGPAVRGPQGRPVLHALRHGAVLPRGRPGLRGRRGPVGLRALPRRRAGGRAARGRHAAGLDHDAVDARVERRASRSTRSSPTSAPPTGEVLAEALVERVLGEDAEVVDRFTGRDMLGARYEPPFPFIPGEAYGPKGAHRAARRLRHRRGRHGDRPHGDRVRRGRLPARAGAGPRGGQPGAPRRHLRRAHRPVRRALGQGRRPGPRRGPARPRPAAARGALPARLPALLALRHAAALLRQAVLVHPHVARCATGCSPPTRRSTGTRSTSSTGASGAGWRTTSTGRSRASATGARRCRCGAARTATRSASAPSPTWRSARAARCPTRTARSSTSTPGPARSAARRCAACPRSSTCGSTRARCRSPSSTPRSRTRTRSSARSPPTTSARRSTRRAAGSTPCSRSRRCCSTSRRTAPCSSSATSPTRRARRCPSRWATSSCPWEVIDRHGADAFRWYFLTSKQPWDGYLFSADTVGESVRQFLLQLWNTYGFYVLYANVNDVRERGEPATDLDRWAISRLHATVAEVRERMEAFDATRAGHAIAAFVDDLSNWYVRRSRRRFWDGDPAAFGTLHACLVGVAKLLAPFCPFLADAIYENLDGREPSVHLCDFPEPGPRDEALEAAMAVARETVQARTRRARAREAQGAPAAARGGGRRVRRGARGDRAARRRRARRAQRQGAALRRRGRRARLLRRAPELPDARAALRPAHAAGGGGGRGARSAARRRGAARRRARRHQRRRPRPRARAGRPDRWPCARSTATSSSARARTRSRWSSSSTTSCAPRCWRARSSTPSRTPARRPACAWRTGSSSRSAATASCWTPRARTRTWCPARRWP